MSHVKGKGNLIITKKCYWLWILKGKGMQYYLPLRMHGKDCLYVHLNVFSPQETFKYQAKI